MKPNPVATAAPVNPRATRALVLTFAVLLLAGCGSAAATGAADEGVTVGGQPLGRPGAGQPGAGHLVGDPFDGHHRGRHDPGSRGQHVLRRCDRGRAGGARTL